MKKYLILVLSLLTFFTILLANDSYYQQIPRISYVKGNVQIEDQNGGWSNCNLNLPVIQGNRIVTGPDGRVEIEFDDGSAFRANSNSEFFIAVLSSDYEKIEVVSGSFILKTVSDIEYETICSTGNILVKEPSNVRIDVKRSGEIKIFVREGRAFFRNEFHDKRIKEGRGLYIYNGGREYSKIYSQNLDDFDFWSDRRDSRYTYSESRKYIPSSNIYVGIYDLDHYGRWVFLDDYGYCWSPAIYDAEWAPYRYGYWRYCNPWGWTWISYEPWGWLPYHYGRWFFSSGFGWVWIPGRHWGVSFWSPGLVRFSIWDNYIGWVPLGPDDYYCYDCGWNRDLTVVNNYTNVNYYNLTNLHVRNAATIVNINDFRRGRPLVRRNSLVENHRPYIPEAARRYRDDPSLVNKMFSRNRIVRTRLNIRPANPVWRENVRISDIRKDISRSRGSIGNSYRGSYTSLHQHYSRINRRYGSNRSNTGNINNHFGVDISHSNISSGNRRTHYGPINVHKSNNGRNSHPSGNPHNYHRNNNRRNNSNPTKRSRKNNFHRNSQNLPGINHYSNPSRFFTEKPISNNSNVFINRHHNIRPFTPITNPHYSYHEGRSYNNNFNYRRNNNHSSFRRNYSSAHHYSYRSYSINRYHSSGRTIRHYSSNRSNNYRKRR